MREKEEMDRGRGHRSSNDNIQDEEKEDGGGCDGDDGMHVTK